MATTATRRDQVDGSTRFAFRVLWKGGKSALEDAMVVLDHRTLDEIPVRFILKSAPGSDTLYVFSDPPLTLLIFVILPSLR